jgi:beta-xylosidase
MKNTIVFIRRCGNCIIRKSFIGVIFLLSNAIMWAQSPYVSEVWVADLGNGTYKNPVLYADYSDPDICRAGDDYYMTSSSFNCIPGLQILHSKDLVNWQIVSAAIPYALEPRAVSERPQHGNRVWAPSIRYHKGLFYIFWGDPDYGIYMTKAGNPSGRWSEPVLIKAGKGLIDATPLWDDGGRVYLVHAFAGSRAGLKSVLAVCELNPDATEAITESRIVFDGHEGNETVEGPKFYKRDSLYYIFAPAGGVATGWQLVLRSRSPYGPYESKTALAQGKTNVNGPHQGAWVDTKTGEDWFFHFQDVGAYGRIVHLQPMRWIDGWPVIGEDKDGDGCGEPVGRYRKPNVGASYPVCTPKESDEFDDTAIGLQWQWHADFNPKWIFADAANSRIKLYSHLVALDCKNLWDVPNLLLQKTPAPSFTATTKMTFRPSSRYEGERTGLVVIGLDYGALIMENTARGLVLSQVECKDADKGNKETVNEELLLEDADVYLRVTFDNDAKCRFGYSMDNKKYATFGRPFQAREGKWIGAKVGVFCTRPAIATNDGGWVEIDWFRITGEK